MPRTPGEADPAETTAPAPASTDALAWRAALATRGAAAEPPAAARGPVTLALVVPCYHEAEVLPTTIERIADLRARLLEEGLIRPDSTAWFVDDGSRDATWSLVELAARTLPWVHGVKLARNRGHQAALLAGLTHATGDAVVSIDADLQDDLGATREMLRLHAGGAEIVFGVRRGRRADSAFKRATAEGYYRLLGALGVEVVFNHADYRLMGRRAVEALLRYGEVNLFLRGLVPQLGFRTAEVHYDRTERTAGETKYPLRRMLSFAWEGLTSFSTLPLRSITWLGFATSAAAFGVALWALLTRLLDPDSVPGWASIVVPMGLLAGIQLLSIGVIGEYVGKTYAEAKRRPRFDVERTL